MKKLFWLLPILLIFTLANAENEDPVKRKKLAPRSLTSRRWIF